MAGEGDYLLRTRKLKMGFCGCSDTRRAFSRVCIAKCAYHKPSLSRRMGAALPLRRPCGSATRRRPSRRGPQRPWGAQGICVPAREAGFGRKGPNAGGKGILLFFRMNALISQMIGEYKCRSPFRDPRSSSRPGGPNALGFIKRIQARDGAGPRSARTDSPMPAALFIFSLHRAPRSALSCFWHTARLLVLCCLSGF